MPWIKLTAETKQLIRERVLPGWDFLPNENDRGELFLEADVYERLKKIDYNLDHAVQKLCRRVS